MRFLLAVWLITLFSLSTLSAADQPLYAYSPPGGAPIAFDDYWNLVKSTRQTITQLATKPEATVRQDLDTLAAQWEQVTVVELSDHSTMQVDSSYLAAELRHDPPELKRLGNEFDALLRAHEEYPQKVFTLEDVAPLKEILRRPEFQWQQAQPLQMPDWLTKLYDRLIAIRDRIILRVATLLYEGRTLLKIAAALLFLLSLFFISRGLSRSLVHEAQLAAEGDGNDELLTSKGAFKRAETLSMQGDYRNAIRYLYLSSLLVLDEQGLMRYDRARTNREYLRSVSSKPELAKPLSDVIDVFDRVWYGFEGVDEETYQSYVERVDELREKKE
jgi:uncharacterized protein DUF4129